MVFTLTDASSNLAKCFVTKELMRWPGIESLYGPYLQPTTIFSSDKVWEDLHTRVIEHVRYSYSPSIQVLLTFVRSAFTEYSSHCRILHPNYPAPPHLPPRSYPPTSRRNPLAAGCVWHCLGANRPTRWDYKLQTSEERRGCDERLEFRHAKVAEFGGEGVDGSERRSGSGRKDKSMRDEDLKCTSIFFSTETESL